jgi:hypothetical protein
MDIIALEGAGLAAIVRSQSIPASGLQQLGGDPGQGVVGPLLQRGQLCIAYQLRPGSARALVQYGSVQAAGAPRSRCGVDFRQGVSHAEARSQLPTAAVPSSLPDW